jgi:mannose-6-phosphate isomerase
MPDSHHRNALGRWLLCEAYPLWSQRAWDERQGGFYERLAADGPLVSDPRRARVQLRQIYSFACAPELGWEADVRDLVVGGLAHLRLRYVRKDGLVRAVVGPDGAVVDDRALLYDQAFTLLAFAAAHRALGPDGGLEQAAAELLERIRSAFKRRGPGFRSEGAADRPLSSNPHMHLLEAALAWRALSDDPRWSRLVEDLVALALDHLIDAQSGVVREHFEVVGTRYEGLQSRLVEPGHQFEWSWLLLRAGVAEPLGAGCASRGPDRAAIFAAAKRLIGIGESHGVRNAVAVNALLDDMSVHDPRARLWPQAERLKAHALMARLTGEAHYAQLTAQAVDSLLHYLDTGVRGLWHDQRLPDGGFISEPSPASSFYHIVCAAQELMAAL